MNGNKKSYNSAQTVETIAFCSSATGNNGTDMVGNYLLQVKGDQPPDSIQTCSMTKPRKCQPHSCNISVRDRQLILSKEKIDDGITTEAMKLVMAQVPHLEIQATSLSSIPDQLTFQSNPTIFIHHTGSHHFVTSTSIGGVVRIFDSLNTIPTPELLMQIKAIYTSPQGDHSQSRHVEHVPIKFKQKGGTDCGVYAIAYAVDLALGTDPIQIPEIQYIQQQMRQHLLSAFNSGHISPFPRRLNTGDASTGYLTDTLTTAPPHELQNPPNVSQAEEQTPQARQNKSTRPVAACDQGKGFILQEDKVNKTSLATGTGFQTKFTAPHQVDKAQQSAPQVNDISIHGTLLNNQNSATNPLTLNQSERPRVSLKTQTTTGTGDRSETVKTVPVLAGQKRSGPHQDGPEAKNRRGNCRSDIKTFFASHYDLNNQTNQVNVKEVYKLYKETFPNSPIKTTNAFQMEAGKLSGLKLVRKKTTEGRETLYKILPTTAAAKNAHNHQEDKISIYTGNIQGLVSKSKGNKCQYIKGITDTRGSENKIIALTETWLRKKQHYDGEILNGISNQFRLFRADRDTDRDPEDESNLSSRGGCAILTSASLVAES